MSEREREGATLPGVGRMSSFAALGWALGVTLAFFGLTVLFAIVASKLGAEDETIVHVASGVVQFVVYGGAVLFIRARYMRDVPLGRALGFRTPPLVMCLLALVIGATATVWEDAFFQFILKLSPLPEGVDQVGLEGDPPLALVVVRLAELAVLVPFTEEILFRGGLMRPLLAQRTWVEALVITSLLFAMAHFRWQYAVPILPLALCLGGLRLSSGSIVPSMLLHVGYNTSNLVLMMVGGAKLLTLPVLLGSLFVSALATWGVFKIGETHPRAVKNRQEEA